jgi:hypothetical protein
MGYSNKAPGLEIERPRSFSGCRKLATSVFFYCLFYSFFTSQWSSSKWMGLSLKTYLINYCLIVFPVSYLIGLVWWKTEGWSDKIEDKISHSIFLQVLYIILLIVCVCALLMFFMGFLFFSSDMWYVDFTSYIF